MRIIKCPLCTVTEQRLARRSWDWDIELGDSPCLMCQVK